MIYLRSSILATLTYYDVFDFPLTILETYKSLINPARLHKLNEGVGNVSLGYVAQELEGLAVSGLIDHENGFYFLPGRNSLYDRRIEKEKITSAKWKKFLRLSEWFQAAPYIRGMFASGSLAINNASLESDFDVLTIVQSGRLYTCRLFLWLISSLLGARRKKFDTVAPDKFCLNHYITDDSLTITHESLYNAQTYANLKPVLIDKELIHSFYTSNIWINKFVHNFKVNDEFIRRTPRRNPFLQWVAGVIEFLLNSGLGDKIERMAKQYQQKRIVDNPMTYENGGRVTFNDRELEFHPRSFEAIVIQRYNQGLRRCGIVPYIEEKDSGLIPNEVA